jgi:adenosylmethionine-8-amino-7-oxononanoate aminotransferase
MVLEDVRRFDREHLWHPFTQMAEYLEAPPFVVVKGDGNWLVDDEGRRLFDATSALWCNLFGHRVKAIDDAVSAQLRSLAHSTLLGATHPRAAELAARLATIAPPGLSRVFLSDNGATAVEAALKIAFQHYLQTRGPKEAERATFLSLSNAYHGDTLGAAAVGGVDLFHETFRPLLMRGVKVPSPYCYRCPEGREPGDCPLDDAAAVEETLAREGGRICAVILEPRVQAAAGMLIQPPGFVKGVAEACRRHGALLILDEVATGFGRTGTLFACEQEGVRPDLLCVAKGLTGGYLPVAATLATEEVYATFLGRYEEYRHFFHGHTYTGNALGCAAALATLGLLAEEGLMERVRSRAALLKEALAPLADHPRVGDIRQAGLLAGIELVADRRTKTPFTPSARVGYRIGLALREKGIFLRPLGDVLVIVLPLSVSEDEVRHLVEGLRSVLEALP